MQHIAVFGEHCNIRTNVVELSSYMALFRQRVRQRMEQYFEKSMGKTVHNDCLDDLHPCGYRVGWRVLFSRADNERY